jgi:outer membrane protein OmpA-like peptidoglycan-associated protein
MRRRGQAALAILTALAVLGGAGCVTKRQFRDNAQSTDGRISAVEDSVEANERRVEDLRKETDTKVGAVDEKAGRALETGTQALGKAEAAEIAARGKIIWQVTLSDDRAKFAYDKALLSPDAMADLDDLAVKVKSFGKAVYLEIEGHTDSNGSDAYNMILGERRAEAARNYLNQKGGIPLHAMSTISYGESQPVADNGTADGRSQNRRVVVKVLE